LKRFPVFLHGFEGASLSRRGEKRRDEKKVKEGDRNKRNIRRG